MSNSSRAFAKVIGLLSLPAIIAVVVTLHAVPHHSNRPKEQVKEQVKVDGINSERFQSKSLDEVTSILGSPYSTFQSSSEELYGEWHGAPYAPIRIKTSDYGEVREYTVVTLLFIRIRDYKGNLTEWSCVGFDESLSQ